MHPAAFGRGRYGAFGGTGAMTTVGTERLILRPWVEEDRTELERLLADPAVRGGRNFSPDRIARLAEHSVRQWRVNGFGPWAAIEKASGRWIGRIGLDELEDWPDVHKIEVGFELHAAWWGVAWPPRQRWPRSALALSSTGLTALSASRRPPTQPLAELWRRPGSDTKARGIG